MSPSRKPETILECIQNTELEMIAYARGYLRNKKINEKLIKETKEAAKRAEIAQLYVRKNPIQYTGRCGS